MSHLGHFTRLRGLFTGRVRTLAIDAHIVLVPTNQPETQTQPQYTVHLIDADGPEVGAAWKKTSDRAGDYLSVQLDCPSLPAPISAKLFQQDADKKVWIMVWSRTQKREEPA